jgi:tetratricopeptide (TPR) repeat protein
LSHGSAPGEAPAPYSDDVILILASYPHSAVLRSMWQGLRANGATAYLAGVEGYGHPQDKALLQLDPRFQLDVVCEPDAHIDEIIAACPSPPTAIVALEAGVAFFPRGLPDVAVPTLYLIGEDWIHADYHERILPLFDRVLTAFSSTERLYAGRGFDHVALWYFVACYDFIEHRSGPRPVDVSFWGNLEPVVQRRRNRVVEAFLELRHEGYEISIGQGAFYHVYSDRLNESKIVIHDGQSRQINMRVIEAMQAGCLVIAARPTDPDDPSAGLFTEGEEIVFFDDIEHARDLVRHYLAHDDERQRIADAGNRKVLRDFAVEIPARRLLDEHIHAIPADFRERRARRLAAAESDEATILTHYFALNRDPATATRVAGDAGNPLVLNNLAVAAASERRFNDATAALEAALAERPSMAIARANLVAVRHFSQEVTDWPAHREWIEQQIAALGEAAPAGLEPADLYACCFPPIYSRFRLEHAAAFRDHPPGVDRNRRLLDLHRYRLHQYAAEAAMFDQKFDVARLHFAAALEVVPDDGYVHANVAAAAAELGELPTALESLERAVDLEPFFADAAFNLVGLCLHLGDAERARVLLRGIIDIPMLDKAGREAAREQLAALTPPAASADT